MSEEQSTALVPTTTRALTTPVGPATPASLEAMIDAAKRIATIAMMGGIIKGNSKNPTDLARVTGVILEGIENGVTPFAAMKGIHVLQGQVTLGASLIASMIHRSGRYGYRQLETTNELCRLEFYDKERPGEDLVSGEVVFTLDDAKKAGVLKNPVWQKYTQDMLFHRALTRGARRYCAGVFGGAVYTPEEIEPNGPLAAADIIEAECKQISEGIS